MSLNQSLNYLFPGKSEVLKRGVFRHRKRKRQQDQDPPPRALIRSYQDFDYCRSYNNDAWERDDFFYFSKDDEIFWGFSTRPLSRLAAWKAALKRISDERIFPAIPKDTHTALTVVPAEVLASSRELFHVKHVNLMDYYYFRDIPMRRFEFLAETLIMETLAGPNAQVPPHPNIIRYHGCRVHRGYITGIVLERLEYTLYKYVSQPGFRTLDKKAFIAKLRSAVDHVHSLGLAHNDINPSNIMVREIADGQQPEPVLIDFGSRGPFGCEVWSQGTPGWYQDEFSTSEKKLDLYSLAKVEKWLETAGSPDEV
ncbi:kinase-like domain-containing protein [Aspergillus keveii]|uniref:Kinase-like domain-containing protein n=1 Tax=Aspergillus keveii TaxID=714993 RepID=A0ABR4GB47_9EURO